MTPEALDIDTLEAALRSRALAYPEATEDFPWGERVIKVHGKIFVFLWKKEAALSVTVKLPASHEFALMMPGCEPTGYGLGRSGWVTAHVSGQSGLDSELLTGWIDESYRTVAPKRLLKLL